MTLLTHRGYSAAIDYDDDHAVFIARPAGLPGARPLRAADMTALRRAFEREIDLHLEARDADAAARPWGGLAVLRIDAGVHAECALAAGAAGMEVTVWIERTLRAAAERRLTAEGVRTPRPRPVGAPA